MTRFQPHAQHFILAKIFSIAGDANYLVPVLAGKDVSLVTIIKPYVE
ncbi:hypothetical protein HMPREF0201_02566 [Cedecea davisae DSM 4568]|uniref:Uncharacterized protein n=1 Tax=Cedecea davisae DSM 4568 TaxID=566551 RepID=S3IUG0_9ENTR|nr:hypothetical protein HMPREF0201_02566 [Cedecea davisae DSM 4568]